MWPPNFEDPVAHQSMFPDLKESGEYQRKRLVPIKSAINDANSSVFGHPLATQFRNMLIKIGDKEKADHVIQATFHQIKQIQLAKVRRSSEERAQHIVTDPVKILEEAVENGRPILNLHKVRVGSVTYNVPVPITRKKSVFIGIKWILDEVNGRDKKAERFYQSLADVLVDTAAYTGKVINRKHEHHRVCEQNRAYARYRHLK